MLILVLCSLVCLVSAQGGLPDSITNTDCATLRATSPHICCNDDTGLFCPTQCNNGYCAYVDPVTGFPIDDCRFPENSESIDCSSVVEPVVTTDAPEEERSDSRSRTNSSDVMSGSGLDRTDSSRSRSNSTGSGAPETTAMPDVTMGSGDRSDSGRSRDNSTGSRAPETTAMPDVTMGSGDRSDSGRSRDNSTGSGAPETTAMPDVTMGSGDRSDSGRSRDNSTGSGTGAPETTAMPDVSMGSGDRSDSRRSRGGSTTDSDPSTTTMPDVSRSRSDTRDNSTSRCPTVSELLSDGCVLSCLVEDDDNCPDCNDTCLALLPSEPPTSEGPCTCTADQVCLQVGRFGEPMCVDLLSEGERCDAGSPDDYKDDKDDKSETKSKNRGSSSQRGAGGARDRQVLSGLGNATLRCKDGLVCTPVSSNRSECLPENLNGPCVIANQGGMEYDCAPDGSFEPLQCRPEGQNLLCFCADPSDGTPVPDTETIVTTRDDAPLNCANLFGCDILRNGQIFNVPHGDFFVNVDDCERCLCNNGEATMCEPSLCVALQQSPPECVYEDESYNHGELFQLDCNFCGCNSGNISCTHLQCDDQAIEDKCTECLDGPVDHVCGINGLTYASACAAIYCGGLAPFDFVAGDCQEVDACALYPCDNDEQCFRTGGIVCFDASGCDPDDLRLCVDRDNLICDDDDDDNAVCGTNGVTYPSLCRLIQETGNEAVAYAGECDRDECQGGPVCGTDRVTYDNVCALRAQSANARVDFTGECDERPGESPADFCERVVEAGRCAYNTSNCDRLVSPEEGCCPLCGGIIIVALDFAGLRDYIRINPSVRTLDDIIEALVESGFISDEVTDRCELEATLTTTRNIQITLSAEDDDDAAFCNEASEKIAAAINDPSTVTGDPLSVQVPEVLQFASAAVSASYQPSTISATEGGSSRSANGSAVLKGFTSFALVVFAIITLFTY